MIYDLVIIGGGPAGITAGIYAARQKLNTLLIAKNFGGQMALKAVDIENYPGFEKISGFDLIKKFEEHLMKQKINIERDEAGEVKKIKDIFYILTKGGKRFESRAVIIASGADPRPLEVPGEKEFIGKGVSYCVACDGPLFDGKTVAVIGGGNSGFEAAIFLAKIAKKIYLLEYGDQIKADQENQKLVKAIVNIQIITNAAVKKIQGKELVESLVYQDRESKKEITIALDGVFVEIGLVPATGFVKDLVDFNERDEIIADPKTGQTKTPGLFAAGDVENVPYKQIVIAAGEGAKVAWAVNDYLQKNK